MKIKIVLLCSFVIIAFGCSKDSVMEDSAIRLNSNSVENEATSAKLPGGSVTVKWEIGRKSRGCDGFGICRRTSTVIEIEPLPPVDIELFRRGQFFYGDLHKVNRDQVLISVGNTARQYIHEYFGGYYLQFDEDMYFDFTDVGAASNFRVATGVYPMAYDPDDAKYYITLDNRP